MTNPTCRAVRRALAARAAAPAHDAHLAGCAACRAEAELHAAIDRGLAALPPAAPPGHDAAARIARWASATPQAPRRAGFADGLVPVARVGALTAMAAAVALAALALGAEREAGGAEQATAPVTTDPFPDVRAALLGGGEQP